MILKALKAVVFLLVVDVLVDPGNLILGLKEVLFVSVFILWVFLGNYRIDRNILILAVVIGLIIPAYGFMVGIIRMEAFSLSESLQYFKGFLFFFLIIVITQLRIDLSRNMVYASFVIVAISIYIYLSNDVFSPDKSYYLVERNAATISRRTFGGILFDPVVFYKTSPVLIFPLAYYLYKSLEKLNLYRLIAIVLICFTLFISATRANIISAGLLLLLYLHFKLRERQTILYAVYLVAGLAFAFLLLPGIMSDYIFNPNEQSFMTKWGHLVSYIDLFKTNWPSLLFGQGMGAGFYSLGDNELVYKTELTYLELIRMFGIAGFLVIFFCLLLPVYMFYSGRGTKVYDKHRYVYHAYLLYLFIEIASNPLLIGSTGMVVMVAVFSSAFYVYKSQSMGRKQLRIPLRK